MNDSYCTLSVCWIPKYKGENQLTFDLQVLSNGERHRHIHSLEYDKVEGEKCRNADTDTLQGHWERQLQGIGIYVLIPTVLR